jgi:hypothetical protein
LDNGAIPWKSVGVITKPSYDDDDDDDDDDDNSNNTTII